MENIQTYLPGLLAVFAAISVAFMSPGPNFLGIVSSAVKHRSNGVFVGLGISFGTAVWAFFASTGVTAILMAYDNAAFVLGILGGVYLSWLGFKSLRDARTSKTMTMAQEGEAVSSKPFASLQKGMLIQLTNPKTAMFWLAVAPLAISPQTPWSIIAMLVLGCFTIAVVWHVLLALMFSSGPARSGYLRLKPTISVIFGILFIGLGLKLVYGSVIALMKATV